MVEWTLKGFLQENAITPYQLAKASRGKLSMNAVYNASDSDLTGVRFETLNTLLETLSELTGREVAVTDLIKFTQEESGGQKTRKG